MTKNNCGVRGALFVMVRGALNRSRVTPARLFARAAAHTVDSQS
jgi:hypothetical protein